MRARVRLEDVVLLQTAVQYISGILVAGPGGRLSRAQGVCRLGRLSWPEPGMPTLDSRK